MQVLKDLFFTMEISYLSNKTRFNQLKNKKMLLHERDGFNMNRIRKIARLHPNSIWDPENADYGSLVDSIMLGFTHVTIDGWVDLSKLK